MGEVMTDQTLPSRITLLGGEMLTWSDLKQSAGGGPFASSLVVPMLSRLLAGTSRALVVGPHAAWLLEHLADSVGSLDIVLRSWPDAHTLNLQLNAKPVRIFCGAFEKFQPDNGPYDVVLALDGIPRLFSADGEDLPWISAVGRLRDLVRPGGHLVLGVANALGLDQMLDADASVKPPTDDQWPSTTTAITTPPPGLQTIRRVLTGHDLEIREQYAVYPRLAKASLMVHERTLAGSEGDEAPAILASAAFASGMGDRPVLTDPRRMAREMMRHGVGLELAPGWLFVVGLPNPDAPDGGAEEADYPSVLITDNLDHPYWSTVLDVTRGDDGAWRRELLDVGRSATTRAAGHLQRDPQRLVGAVPPGDLLEEQFLTACRLEDLNALRRLVRLHADWLHKQSEVKPWSDPWATSGAATERWVVSGEAVFATFENVMIDGDRLALLDPSWSTTLQVPYEIALTRALRRFGYRVLAGGLRHPWPSGMSPNRLTVTLASMVGVTVTPQLLERSSRLEVELEGQQRTNTETDDQQLYFDLQTMGEQPMGTEPGQPRGYREALATVGRLSSELSEALSQIEWLDKTVQLREDQLRRERKLSSDVKNSVSFAIGRGVTAPFRALFRLFRPIFRAMTPSSSEPSE
jgi:hypothetical protein